MYFFLSATNKKEFILLTFNDLLLLLNKGGPCAWHSGPCFLAFIVTDPEMCSCICVDQTFSEVIFLHQKYVI